MLLKFTRNSKRFQRPFYYLRQIRLVRRSLTMDAAHALVRAMTHSRLDYCNILLAGLPTGQMSRLQSVLRGAARLVLGLPGRAPVSAAMHDMLHWLSYQQRVTFKLCLLTYKCLHGLAPDTCRASARYWPPFVAVLSQLSVTFSCSKQTAGPTILHDQLWTAFLRVFWPDCLEWRFNASSSMQLGFNFRQLLKTTLFPVVKVVVWSRGGGAHLTKPGWSKPHTHSNPTNLALFRHKAALYRFNQGAHTIARGLKWEQGAEPPRAPSL